MAVGSFDDEIDTAKAYDKAVKTYNGDFAVLNFKSLDDTGGDSK